MISVKKLLIFLISVFVGFSVLILFRMGQNEGVDGIAVDTAAKRAALKPLPPLAKTVPKAQAYTIIMVGDSMTQLMGENSDSLRKYLKTNYGEKIFGIFNYGIGSTNVLSLEDKLNKTTQLYGKDYPPILQREFDLILIESFGNNPLSHLKLDEGIKKNNQALDSIVSTLRKTHPKSVIGFVVTIAPSRTRYGEGQVVLSPEKRNEWADERIAYMKNHMEYAKKNGIYLIDIYSKSLIKRDDGTLDGNIDYLSGTDFIHPSPTGIDLISKTIAEFIIENKILPI